MAEIPPSGTGPIRTPPPPPPPPPAKTGAPGAANAPAGGEAKQAGLGVAKDSAPASTGKTSGLSLGATKPGGAGTGGLTDKQAIAKLQEAGKGKEGVNRLDVDALPDGAAKDAVSKNFEALKFAKVDGQSDTVSNADLAAVKDRVDKGESIEGVGKDLSNKVTSHPAVGDHNKDGAKNVKDVDSYVDHMQGGHKLKELAENTDAEQSDDE